MAAFKGSLIKVEVGDGASPEVFKVFAGARNVTIALNNEEINITTAEDVDAGGVTWNTYLSGVVDLNISLDGVIKDSAAFEQIVADSLDGTVRNYRVLVSNAFYFSGPGTLIATSIEGPFDDAGTYSLSLRAAAAWVKSTGTP